MRLIDADALIQKRSHAKNYSPDMYVIGQGYVMGAETAEVATWSMGSLRRKGFRLSLLARGTK